MSQVGAIADHNVPVVRPHHSSGHRNSDAIDAGCRNRGVAKRVIVSCGDAGLADDYFRFLEGLSDNETRRAGFRKVSAREFIETSFAGDSCPDEIVVFLDRQITGPAQKVFTQLAGLAATASVRCLIVFPSLLTHLADDHNDKLQELVNRLGDAFCRPALDSQQQDLVPPDRIDDASVGRAHDPEGFGFQDVSELIVIRTGYVLSPSSATSKRLQRLRGLQSIFLPRMTTTFLEGVKLFSIIDEELHRAQAVSRPSVHGDPPSKSRENAAGQLAEIGGVADSSDEQGRSYGIRQLTLLGTRHSWQAVIPCAEPSGIRDRSLIFVAVLLRLVGIPWLLLWGICLLQRILPSVRQWHFHTLKPRSVPELISLYNRHNCSDVQIAGYNNGVNHFGWKFPGKTVVLTTGLPGKTQCLNDSRSNLETRLPKTEGPLPNFLNSPAEAHMTVDAGLTLNHCIRELNQADREFYVVPNYSWISMGTLFFVPVHGSGSHVSTLGDTIEEVLLYDGEEERFFVARRGEAIFRDLMYNTSRHLLLLRLTLRVKPKTRYFVRRSTMENPSASDVQDLFAEEDASNVEVRKNNAASTAILVSRYYVDSRSDRQDLMEMPRDSIGRVWDRLEETPVVSGLFHWFVRNFAFHVELFLKADEFAIFWEHHRTLPISKIQLRRMLKDGISHSACESEDCISADLFMTRRNRDVFCRFVSTHLPNVRSNPGKQSL